MVAGFAQNGFVVKALESVKQMCLTLDAIRLTLDAILTLDDGSLQIHLSCFFRAYLFCFVCLLPRLAALGAESVLPYLDPSINGDALLRGANFASVGVGILNDAGFQFANIIRIPQQFAYFEEYQRRVAQILGEAETERLVEACFFDHSSEETIM
ncbi:hypothetical protein KI387_043854 [Taxus chinensis]|uniref:Uncharacterized protein n=1 Tax=Taxus chinensis TaxID=29808 RepID=A0AA38FIQ8_TAXCH|nr:hypothetical protein KI387_043854 [Taxus chinensis]